MADQNIGPEDDDESHIPADHSPTDSAGDDLGKSASADSFTAMLGGLTNDPEALDQALRAAGMSDLDPQTVQSMIGQVQQMLATPGGGGPVNWQLATDIARQVVSEHGDPSMSATQKRNVEEALRLADTWLTEHTTLPAAGAHSLAWSAAEWVEGTQPVWRRLVEPVAESVATAMTQALAGHPLPELDTGLGVAGIAQAEALMRQIGGSVFGLQVGQAIGALATEVVSGTEIGLPLLTPSTVVILPSGVTAFGAGLDVPETEVQLYLAIREAARSRLFAHIPWLTASLLGAVEDYARGITIDTDRIESALQQVAPTDPEALQQAMADGLFEPQHTPSQQHTLHRLETMLALIEGWVEVVSDACATALPHAIALRESVRRRRATGGPAEQTFSALVGLQLRPRRLRDAAALWTIIGRELGIDGRDAIWSHPDLMPTADDLNDPLGFAERRTEIQTRNADVDAAIEQLLTENGPEEQ